MFIIDFAHFLLRTAGGGMNPVGGGGNTFERLKGEGCEVSGVVLSGVFGNCRDHSGLWQKKHLKKAPFQGKKAHF